MPDREAIISLVCNNPTLEKILLDSKLHPDLKFSTHSPTKNNYVLFIVDLGSELLSVSQKLIDLYGRCLETSSKLTVVLIHTNKIDTEKNLYFQKMLSDLGKDHPLHRLVFTKDLYQYQLSSPATPFDHYLNDIIQKNSIDISHRGKNYLFPLSLNDFLVAIAKTFFFTSTSGRTFWFLGEPITDLELAYLLKTSLSHKDTGTLEINAVKKDDPQSLLLLDYSTKTKADLNWETDDDFSQSIKKILNLHRENSLDNISEPTHTSFLNKIVNYFHRPKVSVKVSWKNSLKTYLTKISLLALILYSIVGVFTLISTGYSLYQLEKSSQQILNGRVNQSVDSLRTSITFSSMGESAFSFYNPVINLFAPNFDRKIINLFSLISYSQTTLNNIQQTYTLAENLLLSINTTNNQTNYDDIGLALHSNLSQIYENINQITLLSRDDRLPGFVSQKLQNNATFLQLRTLEDQIVQFIKISDVFPYFLSGDKPKNILFLFQNQNILRPSGGSQEYFLLLTINHGSVISQKIYTVSELESLNQSTSSTILKNKKKVEPENTTLASQSIDPDFSRFSTSLSSYIENTLKIKPDYILALNNSLFDKLVLEEKAPSTPSTYREQISFYLDRFINHQITLPVLGRTLAQVITSGQIYLWAADPAVETIFAPQPYSGVLNWHPCHTGLSVEGRCFSETSYLAEDQYWFEPQNPWSSRTIHHTVSLEKNSTIHEYQIDYAPEPTSASTSSILSSYHLYLSSPSSLDQVYLDDLPYSLKQLTKETINNLDHYTLPIELSVAQNHTLKFRLISAVGLSLNNATAYSLTEYRQAGSRDTGILLKINYPEDLRVSVLSQPVTSQPSAVEVTLPSHTTTVGIGFSPK